MIGYCKQIINFIFTIISYTTVKESIVINKGIRGRYSKGDTSMSRIQELKNKVMEAGIISRQEALELYRSPLEELCKAANEIRERFCKEVFDVCTIVNAKSGRCSEDCKYCSQSVHYKTLSSQYPLLDTEELKKQAKYNADRGVLRYSLVTSGRALEGQELDRVCESVREIKKEVDIEICASFGLVGKEALRKMKEAGIGRIHCNLESSESYFPNICTTHTYREKIEVIQNALEEGLSVCSGGIMGLGETVEDRIDMLIDLRELGIRSIPVNFLNPIQGTPYENNEALCEEEKRRIVAVCRFLFPRAAVRLAGGRGLSKDKGRSCFKSGANAVISGDMLTTAGITIEKDMEMIKDLGYKVALFDQE